jgi:CBS domain-containing protein
MQARTLMTPHLVTCTPETSLMEAAQLMCDHGCGCLPVARNQEEGGQIVGMLTDRDIVCRATANGVDPTISTVEIAMSAPVKTIRDDANEDECLRRFREHGVGRLVVVDAAGKACGILTQGHLAGQLSTEKAGELAQSPWRRNSGNVSPKQAKAGGSAQ